MKFTEAQHEEIVRQAKHIDDMHRGQESERIMSTEHNVVSLYGEHCFAIWWGGLTVEIHDGPLGDQGWDFIIALKWAEGIEQFTLDVKAARGTKFLPVNPGDTVEECRVKPIRADIYVLAGARPSLRKAWLTGWAWKEKFAQENEAPIIDAGGKGYYSRTLYKHQLWEMDDLRSIKADQEVT